MIRDWIRRNGGLTPDMIFLRGKELTAMYPLCTGIDRQQDKPDRIATPHSLDEACRACGQPGDSFPGRAGLFRLGCRERYGCELAHPHSAFSPTGAHDVSRGALRLLEVQI